MGAEGEDRLVAVALDGAGGLVGAHRLMLAGLLAPGSSVAPAAWLVAGPLFLLGLPGDGRLSRCSLTHLGLLGPALDWLLRRLVIDNGGCVRACPPRVRLFAGLAAALGSARWPVAVSPTVRRAVDER